VISHAQEGLLKVIVTETVLSVAWHDCNVRCWSETGSAVSLLHHELERKTRP
jgi:hypothetical protein